jgi:hypothetical protein
VVTWAGLCAWRGCRPQKTAYQVGKLRVVARPVGGVRKARPAKGGCGAAGRRRRLFWPVQLPSLMPALLWVLSPM